MCGCLSRAPHTGDLACNPGLCPEWELNWKPFGLQASAQSTEPQQPELQDYFHMKFYLHLLSKWLPVPCFFFPSNSGIRK